MSDTRPPHAIRGRVLVTGSGGLLGRQLLGTGPPGVDPFGALRTDGDLREAESIAALFADRGPFSAVIHAAGYTDVDGAEREPERAHSDNAVATRHVARACAAAGIPLLLVSTDYVFDGSSRRPYRESDAVAPLGVYGRTKWEAEQAAREEHPEGTRIVRTQWLYGAGGRSFPDRILELARKQPDLRVVNDQVGSPTSVEALAPALWDLLALGPPGTYHAACEGACSWWDLACATLELAGVRNVPVHPVPSTEYPRPAPRPSFSVLDCSRLAALRGHPLPHWREALMRYLARRRS